MSFHHLLHCHAALSFRIRKYMWQRAESACGHLCRNLACQNYSSGYTVPVERFPMKNEGNYVRWQIAAIHLFPSPTVSDSLKEYALSFLTHQEYMCLVSYTIRTDKSCRNTMSIVLNMSLRSTTENIHPLYFYANIVDALLQSACLQRI